MNDSTSIFVLIPAAGSGARLGATLPKQYLRLRERTVLEWTVERLRQGLQPTQIAAVLSPQDKHFDDLPATFTESVLALHCGGATRAETVRNGLQALMQEHGAAADAWVAVHDAARPCVPLSCLQALKAFTESASNEENGALLATPLADTLKRVMNDGDARETLRVAETMDRQHFGVAQTPQIFRCALLLEALNAEGAGSCTDESQAVEHWCREHPSPMPALVRGSALNVKITYPEDMVLAETILEQQQKE